MYDICHQFRRRLRSSDHPHDARRLRSLVLSLAEGGHYPWTSAQLSANRFSDQDRCRFESKGWLVRIDDGDRAKVWHDRLLNWAIAEALFHERASNQLDQDGFVDKVLACSEMEVESRPGRLGYLLGDVFWHLSSNQNAESTKDGVALAHMLSRQSRYQGRGLEDLFRHVLGTLGTQILPILDELVRGEPGGTWSAIRNATVDCLIVLSVRSKEACNKLIEAWLSSSCDSCRAAATSYLAEHPDAALLDAAWKNHLQVAGDFYAADQKVKVLASYEQSSRALRKMSGSLPEWIAREIKKSSHSQESMAELCWLLAATPVGSIESEWGTLKPILISQLEGTHDHALVSCFKRFKDAEEVPRLKRWATEHDSDHTSGVAFAALCKLDPDTALSAIDSVADDVLYLFRNSWLPTLLESRPLQEL